MEKRIVSNDWYTANGIPVPKANLTIDEARDLVSKCQKIKHDPEASAGPTSPKEAYELMVQTVQTFKKTKA